MEVLADYIIRERHKTRALASLAVRAGRLLLHVRRVLVFEGDPARRWFCHVPLVQWRPPAGR